MLGHAALEYVSPTRCVSCNAPGNTLCRACLFCLGELPELVCSGCGAASPTGQTCRYCQTLQAPLDQLVSAYSYENHYFHKALATCKENGNRDVMPYLAARLARRLLALDQLPNTQGKVPLHRLKQFILVPVPATKSRQIERGFNQAELLAQSLGSLLHLPVYSNLLERKSSNSQQKTLSLLDRRSHLAGTYKIIRPLLATQRNILLCDDVATTLATQETCAQLLRDAGARIVVGAVLAHAQH